MESLLAKNQSDQKDLPEFILSKALTKKELKHLQFNYLKKGKLYVKVDNSTWLYYFNMHKENVLTRLQEADPEIKDVSFRLGTLAGQE